MPYFKASGGNGCISISMRQKFITNIDMLLKIQNLKKGGGGGKGKKEKKTEVFLLHIFNFMAFLCGEPNNLN